MTRKELLSTVDHTLLAPDATMEQIQKICDDAIRFSTASVCIPPSFVKRAKEYVGDQMKICTVIGFPLGYHSPKVKELETRIAVEDGADEIDMVIDIGLLKEGNLDAVKEEILLVRKASEGKILKVIIETCLLTDEEKEEMCRIVGEAGADFIKTSTGFSTGGATAHDIALFQKHCKKPLQIKAAGGIKTLSDAEEFLSLGATRLGTSRIVKLIKEECKEEKDEVSHTAY